MADNSSQIQRVSQSAVSHLQFQGGGVTGVKVRDNLIHKNPFKNFLNSIICGPVKIQVSFYNHFVKKSDLPNVNYSMLACI